MWDVSDVKDDVVEHVKVISTTMKKTMSSQFRSRTDDTESTPLLQMVGDSHQNEDYTSSIQSTQAEINQSGYQTQPDALSRTSDWDTTSVERWQSSNKRQGRKSTPSMQNFYTLSTSIDNQSVHSLNSEHLDEHDSLRIKHRSDSEQTADEKQSDSVFEESVPNPVSQDNNIPQVDQSQKEIEESLIDFDEEKNVVLDEEKNKGLDEEKSQTETDER